MPANTYFKLFDNQQIDGNSTPVTVDFGSNKAVAKVWGTFDGATVYFENTAPQTSPVVWIRIPDGSGNPLDFTQDGQRTIEFLVYNEKIRAVVSGAGALTSINVTLEVTSTI